TDIAVGCLGNHRKGIYTIQALKNKEYMAKGLPMIFSEDDPGLREKEFVYKATHDEELINIENLIKWYEKLNITPEEIRKHAEEFTWDKQMKKVIDSL
ncbi:MAG: glycosyltransferase, partial [Cetobacterium sp.]